MCVFARVLVLYVMFVLVCAAGTLAALRATVEKQKQAAQAKTSHATGSDYGQRGFQGSSGGECETFFFFVAPLERQVCA